MSSADAEIGWAAGWRNGTVLPGSPTIWDLYLLHSASGYSPQVFDGNASAWRPMRTRFETGVTNVAPVTNTTTITPVLTTTIPGGVLGTVNALRVSGRLFYLNNSAGVATLTLRLQFGATVVSTISFANVTQNALSRTVAFEGLLSALGAPGAQTAICEGQIGPARTQNGTTDGAPSSTQVSGHDAVAEDSSTDTSLILSVQHSVADAQISVTPTAIYAVEQRGP